MLLLHMLWVVLLVLSMDIVKAVAVRFVVFITQAGHATQSLSAVHRATCRHSIPVTTKSRSKHLVVVDVRV